MRKNEVIGFLKNIRSERLTAPKSDDQESPDSAVANEGIAYTRGDITNSDVEKRMNSNICTRRGEPSSHSVKNPGKT